MTMVVTKAAEFIVIVAFGAVGMHEKTINFLKNMKNSKFLKCTCRLVQLSLVLVHR